MLADAGAVALIGRHLREYVWWYRCRKTPAHAFAHCDAAVVVAAAERTLPIHIHQATALRSAGVVLDAPWVTQKL
jgi:hypothetical protein